MFYFSDVATRKHYFEATVGRTEEQGKLSSISFFSILIGSSTDHDLQLNEVLHLISPNDPEK